MPGTQFLSFADFCNIGLELWVVSVEEALILREAGRPVFRTSLSAKLYAYAKDARAPRTITLIDEQEG